MHIWVNSRAACVSPALTLAATMQIAWHQVPAQLSHGELRQADLLVQPDA